MSNTNKMYCNPLNLSYKFQKFRNRKTIHREAADPSVVYYKEKYWMFLSMSGGCWYSEDLLNWTFKQIDILPDTDYAPDVRVIEDYLYFCASKKGKPCTIYRTNNPLSGNWEAVSSPFDFWDPNLFQDDDGRVYFYWGCSNKTPIYGVQMCKDTMLPIGEKTPLIHGNPSEHGWERFGENNQVVTDNSIGVRLKRAIMGDDPYIEGAWMTKNNGKYYLQYAAPGTDYNVYADGVYVSDKPLGSFEYAGHNPFSLKPGGFITGAGHGSTFQDIYGNWWHVSTMRISVNHIFERRVGLFPAGFDEDGILYCNTNFGDYPINIPNKKWNPWQDYFSGWMLLSYKKEVSTSSTLSGYEAHNAVDENIRTIWGAKKDDEQKWLMIDLGDKCTVNAVQVNFADVNCRADKGKKYEYTGGMPIVMKRAIIDDAGSHEYRVEGSVDGVIWDVLAEKNEDAPHSFIVFKDAHNLRYLRLVCKNIPAGGNFSVSGFRVFGTGSGELPKKTEGVSAERTSALEARINWEVSADATGYNVRWGIAPDKLYSSWMVYDQSSLMLPSLSAGVEYYVCVDSFNECGITQGDVKKIT